MTDYWMGGEQTSWATITSNAEFVTNFYRSAFARMSCAGIGSSTGTTTIPPTDYIKTPILANMSNFWFSCQMWMPTTNGQNTNTANMPCLFFADSGGVIRLLIRGTGTAGQYKLTTRNAAGTLTDVVTSAAGVVPVNPVSNPVQVACYINYSSTGQFQLWIEGVKVMDTGTNTNITTDSATALNQLWYQNFFNTGNSVTGNASEWMLSTVNLLGAGLYTIPPVASGATQSWTPNTVANVNKVTINDGTGVSTATANALSEWTVSTTLPTGSWTISSVQQEVRISCGATGPQNFEFLVRTSDGSDHVAGTTALTTAYQNYVNNWATNPHTSAAWNAGELINAGVESLA